MAERAPLAARDVRRGVRRQLVGVDRDGKARLLDQPRGRQPHHPRADYCHRALMAGQTQVGCEPGGAPAQRDSRAAMTVIVHERLVAERLAADDEA